MCGNTLIVVAGGGVQEHTVKDIVRRTRVREVHGTLRSSCESRSNFRKSGVYMGKASDEDSEVVEYTHKYADGDKIKGVIRVLQSVWSPSL